MNKIQPNPPIPPIAEEITLYINQVNNSLFGLELSGLKKGEKVIGQISKDIENTISAAIKATFDICEVVKITPDIEFKFIKIFNESFSDPFRFYPTTHELDVFKIPPLLATKLLLKSGIIKEIVVYGSYESKDKTEVSSKLKIDIETILKNINVSTDLSSCFIKNVTSHFENIVKYIIYDVDTICNKSWSSINNGDSIKVLGQDIRIKNKSKNNSDNKKIIDVDWIGSVLIEDFNTGEYKKVSDKNNIEIKENENLIFYLKDKNKFIVYCIANTNEIDDNYIKFNFFVMTPKTIDLQSKGNISINNNEGKFS